MASAVQFEANRLKFGLFSTRNCVGPEETAEYTKLSKALWKDLNPVGPVEQMLAVEIVRAAWRLHRCAADEAENGDNPATQAAVDRARASTHNSMRRLLNDLRQFQSDRWLRAEVLREGFDEAYIGIADAHRVIKGLIDDSRLGAQSVGQALSPGNPDAQPRRDREGAPPSRPAPTIRTQSVGRGASPSGLPPGFCPAPAGPASPVAPAVSAAVERPAPTIRTQSKVGQASWPVDPRGAGASAPPPPFRAASPASEPATSQPIPRNAPCPCHSGLKYKRCCGAAAPPVLTTDPRSLFLNPRC